MSLLRFFIAFLILNLGGAVYASSPGNPDDIEKSIRDMPDTREKVDKLNDQVDKILKPTPTKDNCKLARPYAVEAAKIAEKLNYKTGMARSYEQLTVIYQTLDFQIQYLKYKAKALAVDRGEELKKQKDVIEQQNVNIEKQKSDLEKQNADIARQKADIEKQKADAERIKRELALLAQDNSSNKDLIAKKQQELAQKETALVQTSGQLNLMTEKADQLATQNRLLEQDKKIKELEVGKKEMEIKSQRLRFYFLLVILFVLLAMAGVLFNLYRTKQRTNKELAEKNEIIIAEKRRSDELLLNILPAETANELKLTGKAIARDYEMVTVLFTDFKDFTVISENLSPKDLVDEIDTCYSAFDNIIQKFGIEKIKTIGDAYLCAYGIANEVEVNLTHDPTRVIDAAFEIAQFMKEMHEKRSQEGKPFFRIRIGIHSGPLVAGVVGRTKFAYDIWGDTVNTAARMEQNSEPGKINISSVTHDMVIDQYDFTYRGKIEAKNKGQIDMYFVDRKRSAGISSEEPPAASAGQA